MSITVAATQVARIADTKQLTYWPLTGGAKTVVDLPAGARVTPSGVELRDDQLGSAAPRIGDSRRRRGHRRQTDNGAWWMLRADQAPARAVPSPPAGATSVERILVVATNHVFIAWATVRDEERVAGVYDTTAGTQQATRAARCGDLPRVGAAAAGTDTIAGIGPLILSGTNLTAADGATVTAVVEEDYGIANGDAVTVAPNGTTTRPADGTLIPVGQSGEQLLVVDSDQGADALDSM